MDHDRLRAVSEEMCALLEEQTRLLKAGPFASIRQVYTDDFLARNERLRELCWELTELP